ncbi:MAG: phage head closure protein [Thermoguttaceae bacterium]|jgi:SPP1 family predicted phage head-tail adaptor
MPSHRTPIGQMRKRIAILLPNEAASDSGETAGDPTTLCMAWARILPLSGSESWVSQEQQELSSHQINMRYQPRITPKMYATYQGRTFNFTSVRDLDEMHEELEILAKEPLQE